MTPFCFRYYLKKKKNNNLVPKLLTSIVFFLFHVKQKMSCYTKFKKKRNCDTNVFL